MVWRFYLFERYAACVEDFSRGIGNMTISHHIDESDGAVAGPQEKVRQPLGDFEKWPFEDRLRYFTMGSHSQYNPKEYDLELTHKRGLVRRLFSDVKISEQTTHAVRKIAGRGSTEDYRNMAMYAVQRLPLISGEILIPTTEIERSDLPNFGFFEYDNGKVQKIDWPRFQAETIKDFYEMFKKSVEHQATDLEKPFRMNADEARSLLDIVSVLKSW